MLTVKDILHCFTLVRPTHVAVSGDYHEKVQEALRQHRASASTQVFSLLDRIQGVIKVGKLKLASFLVSSNNQQFPEDVEGGLVHESAPPYDLEGQSSKNVVASILFSSGTTGKMKGVKISHYNHIINLMQTRMSVPLRQNSEQRVIFFAPCKHIHLSHLYSGSSN